MSPTSVIATGRLRSWPKSPPAKQVDPALYYFRAAPLFETSAPQYAWLNTVLAMTTGIREKSTVVLDFYVVR